MSRKVVISWLGLVTTIPISVKAASNELNLWYLPLSIHAVNTNSYTANSLIKVVPSTDLVKKAGKNPTHTSGCCSDDIAAYKNTAARPILNNHFTASELLKLLFTVCILA